MPTKNPRINVTFDESVVVLLAQLALHEKKSVSSIAKELILEALERREDMALSKLAEVRDAKKVSKRTHDDVWK